MPVSRRPEMILTIMSIPGDVGNASVYSLVYLFMLDLSSLHQLATDSPPGHLNNSWSFTLPVSEMTVSLTASVLTLIWLHSHQRWELRSFCSVLAQGQFICPVACFFYFRIAPGHGAPNLTFPLYLPSPPHVRTA